MKYCFVETKDFEVFPVKILKHKNDLIYRLDNGIPGWWDSRNNNLMSLFPKYFILITYKNANLFLDYIINCWWEEWNEKEFNLEFKG